MTYQKKQWIGTKQSQQSHILVKPFKIRDDVERIAHAGGGDISPNASQEEAGHLDSS